MHLIKRLWIVGVLGVVIRRCGSGRVCGTLARTKCMLVLVLFGRFQQGALKEMERKKNKKRKVDNCSILYVVLKDSAFKVQQTVSCIIDCAIKNTSLAITLKYYARSCISLWVWLIED